MGRHGSTNDSRRSQRYLLTTPDRLPGPHSPGNASSSTAPRARTSLRVACPYTRRSRWSSCKGAQISLLTTVRTYCDDIQAATGASAYPASGAPRLEPAIPQHRPPVAGALIDPSHHGSRIAPVCKTLNGQCYDNIMPVATGTPCPSICHRAPDSARYGVRRHYATSVARHPSRIRTAAPEAPS
jgi:hypothetical protein